MATCYTSCGCNRTPHAADWGRNDLICFGGCRAVVLCNPEKPAKIIATVSEHTDRVNSCRWIRRGSESENELVSASTDKTVIVWRRCESPEQITKADRLAGHSSAVTVAEGIYVPDEGGKLSYKNRTLIASASVDSTVKIWERKANEDTFTCIQTVSFGTGFILDVSLSILPGSAVPVLSCGGDDQRIHMFVEQNGQFVCIETLHGHEDWVRGVSATVDDNGDMLLASCSQDCYIRIWRISPRDPKYVKVSSIADLSLEEDIKLKENTFTFQYQGTDLCFAVTLESVLPGHENWIYSIKWQPSITTGGKNHHPMCLLSSSMDKTMIMWKPDHDTGLWVEQVRVGEVGGGNLGFYGGIFSPDGKSILSHGFQGAFHMWHRHQDSESWLPGVTTGGHFDAVNDITWDKKGQYLLSTSADQTTRLHAYWKAKELEQCSWHEIARPQVHGYDMQCLAMINDYMFASGADEKVVRVFGATKNFFENFSNMSQVDVSDTLKQRDAAKIPEGASVPALGLSNKAVYEGETQEYVTTEGRKVEANPNAQYPEIYFSPLNLCQPPSEDNLLQNTLWPEIQKLYGHGYEIFALACHPDGSILASACKAAKADHAFIILWDVHHWKQLCHLASHSLTVTQLAFSPSGDYLLSVSRDRTWSLFKSHGCSGAGDDPLYRRVAYTDKKTAVHSRIIWACDWSHDDKYFITVSRDKKAVIWSESNPRADEASCLGNFSACGAALTLPDSVTAVSFAPVLHDDCYIVALGLDNGTIHVVKWQPPNDKETSKWIEIQRFDNRVAHHLTVKRLRFCPARDASRPLLLASCGADHMVKIYNVCT